jgi:flagellin
MPALRAARYEEKAMVLSVNTNTSAMIALQSLGSTNQQLDQVQNRINTGLAVSGPKDNAAIFAIAQNMRSDVGAYSAVSQSLSRGSSIVDVALAAGQSVSDLLTEMKQKAIAAADPSIDSNSLTALNNDFQALAQQIKTVIANANFNGVNILDSTANGWATGGVKAMTTTDSTVLASGKGTVNVAAQDLSGLTALSTTLVAGDATAAQIVDANLQQVNASLAALGSGSKQLQLQTDFVAKLTDTLQSGIGNLVDADMAKESAHLQALQVKQQLGVQALSIANQRPQILLNLFR